MKKKIITIIAVILCIACMPLAVFAAEEKEIQNLYAQIGKSVYHLEKDNAESIYAAECANITERLQRIDELKKNPEAE